VTVRPPARAGAAAGRRRLTAERSNAGLYNGFGSSRPARGTGPVHGYRDRHRGSPARPGRANFNQTVTGSVNAGPLSQPERRLRLAATPVQCNTFSPLRNPGSLGGTQRRYQRPPGHGYNLPVRQLAMNPG
jgi:hypothetical protein